MDLDKVKLGKEVASPISTGNWGAEYEQLVGAYYLALCLIGATARGQDFGVAREVRFQRLYEGEPMDDLIIESQLGSNNSKLALQVKADLTIGENNKFAEVLGACWKTYTNKSFRKGTDRLGIALGTFSQTIDRYYGTALTWARSSSDASDFFTRINMPDLSNQKQSNFVKLVRKLLDALFNQTISDDELWKFLKSMVLIHIDFGSTGGRDGHFIVELLRQRMPNGTLEEGQKTFRNVIEIAGEAKKTAGSHTALSIRERLISLGSSLEPSTDVATDLDKLALHSKRVLADISESIGTLCLTRTSIVNDANGHSEKAPFLILSGSPGCGKSAILKSLALRHASESQVLVLSSKRLQGTGLEGFSVSLGIKNNWNDILSSISISSNPCIFIDGMDMICDDGRRAIINDLVRTIADLPHRTDGTPLWHLVVTARENNIREMFHWLDFQVLSQPQLLHVPLLDDQELGIVGQHYPQLEPILRKSDLNGILATPYILSLLQDSRILNKANVTQSFSTEIDVVLLWWQYVVGASGTHGIARQQALLKIGQCCWSEKDSRFKTDAIDSDAVHSLELDNIVQRIGDRDLRQFTHDVLEDWILFRALDQQRDRIVDFLKEVGEPIGYARPLQLLSMFILERDTFEEWKRVFETLYDNKSLAQRWWQAVLLGIALSFRGEEMLEKMEKYLLADNGKHLQELVRCMLVLEVDPNLALIGPCAVLGKTVQETLPLIWSDPIPRFETWRRFLAWMTSKQAEMPSNLRMDLVRLMDLWQRKTEPGAPLRCELALLSWKWLEDSGPRIVNG